MLFEHGGKTTPKSFERKQRKHRVRGNLTTENAEEILYDTEMLFEHKRANNS
jgi:hypothetical protein